MKRFLFLITVLLGITTQACKSVDHIKVVAMDDYSMLYHDFPDTLSGKELRTAIATYPYSPTDRIPITELSVNCEETINGFSQLSTIKQNKLKREARKNGCQTILTYSEVISGFIVCCCDSITVSELDSLKVEKKL